MSLVNHFSLGAGSRSDIGGAPWNVAQRRQLTVPLAGRVQSGARRFRMGVYQRLGVQPVINARGMNTMASGSLMPQPVLDAMAEAATAFVDMEELNRKSG